MIDIYAAQLPTIPLLYKIVVLTNQNQSRQGGSVNRADQKDSNLTEVVTHHCGSYIKIIPSIDWMDS